MQSLFIYIHHEHRKAFSQPINRTIMLAMASASTSSVLPTRRRGIPRAAASLSGYIATSIARKLCTISWYMQSRAWVKYGRERRRRGLAHVQFEGHAQQMQCVEQRLPDFADFAEVELEDVRLDLNTTTDRRTIAVPRHIVGLDGSQHRQTRKVSRICGERKEAEAAYLLPGPARSRKAAGNVHESARKLDLRLSVW
ncbi:hypothetical protein PsYK624_141120 [Phanerochaete sordida]|uniref:Uncharacterized protein n=1 Tax=Phanerochaete sordida TaxID=48140 RepID=A0A9P3GQY2_9APHY|nr:hypothetical protein PsYK624_141120 [Phanerochaete sordida]